MRVEIQDESGAPIPGFTLDDCPERFQDRIDLPVRWCSEARLGALAGRPVRLRFALYDADIYAMCFVKG